MEPIYRGIDNFDVAIGVRTPDKLVKALAEARERAEASQSEALLEFSGIKLLVAASGGQGGYRYRASTGPFGGTWFFKEPRRNDAWGIRYSSNALPLASRGLPSVVDEIFAALSAFGAAPPQTAIRIGRIDLAIDFLAPDLEIDPANFITHSQRRNRAIEEGVCASVESRGRRVTSVTIGSKNNAQIIVYDKRAEILKKKKHEWLQIWDAALKDKGGFPDIRDPALSRVWRVELRAGRDLLRRQEVARLCDLHKLPCLFEGIARSISYRSPTHDSNRSRWPLHPLWRAVRQAAATMDIGCGAEFDEAKALQLYREQKRRELEAQANGLAISIASLDGATAENFSACLQGQAIKLAERGEQQSLWLEEKLEAARERYALLMS